MKGRAKMTKKLLQKTWGQYRKLWKHNRQMLRVCRLTMRAFIREYKDDQKKIRNEI